MKKVLRDFRVKSLVSLVLVFFLACANLWAQATAQINGRVQDASGSVVPGAEVRATQSETNVVRTTITEADGSYVLINLPIGPYRLEVSKEGFATYVQSGIVLQVNSSPTVNAALQVGTVTQQVVVEASAAMVETRTSGVGQVVENQRILDLPLNGRNVTDLVTLAGAAVQTSTSSTRLFGGIPFFGIAGGVPFGTDYRLDGANHLNFLTGVTMPIPFPDAAQEFKVETSGLNAQRGNSSSVEVVTKAGTNEFHGALFEFLRNDKTSARQYFSVTQSTLKRNQFGGTIGGPIRKDKLFFFGGFQGTTLRSDPASQIRFIPTPAMINGDWTAFASPACNQGIQRTLRGPGWINNIQTNPAANFSPPAVFIARKIIESQQSPPNDCGQVTIGVPTRQNEFQYTGKIDWQLNDKQSAFFRFVATTQEIPNSFSLGAAGQNLLNSSTHGVSALAQSHALGHTYVINPNMINAARISVNRTATTYAYTNKTFSFCAAGVNMWCVEPDVLGSIQVAGAGGGFSIGGGGGGGALCCGSNWVPTNYAVNDDVSWVRGAHQITLGVGSWHGRVNETTWFAPTAFFGFNGQVTGMGMGDFFMGNVNRFFQGLLNSHRNTQWFVNMYLTDTWKMTPRLTLNLGIRWEPYIPQNVPNGAVYNFDINRFSAGTRSTAFVNAPVGFHYPGDPGFPGKTGINSKWAHFAPRVGLAWDPFGDGKTSLRASFAYGYAFNSGIWREDASGSNPWGGRTVLTNPAGGFANPWQGSRRGNPFPYAVDKNVVFTDRGLFLSQAYDLKTPIFYTWNLGVQRQFGEAWLVSATYLGTRTQHIWTQNAINPAQIVPSTSPLGTCPPGVFTGCNAIANTDARRRLSLLNPTEGQFIGPMAEFDDGGTQIYHGLLLSLQRRLSRGVSVSANWTWSHCIGVYSDINSNGPPADETYTMPGNRNFDRGNCDQDRRHLANISFVAQTPRFSDTAAGKLLGGWQFSGIYRFTSGTPIVLLNGVDRALTGVARQRPNQVLQDAYLDKSGKGGSVYLNAAAFQLPPFGSLGNVGWNSLVNPSTWNLDLGLSRRFAIRERMNLEVRAEAFNFTNSYRPNPPTGSALGLPGYLVPTNAQFGRILAALDARITQFALKFTF
ncbi:MAG: hypothetical protein A3H28_13160 [Acidobacteria bacterium RIFCSPLOWO2_02_FULL_61_28]|nr:MAG: hypothetical protein A3H28_13160 [Acidobacteria bacterium RIFCSPLOWO2_02_FULL_61_28]